MRRIAAALSVIVVVALGALAPGMVQRGWAQAYPNRTIRLVIPFPAGGPVDVMGRLIAAAL